MSKIKISSEEVISPMGKAIQEGSVEEIKKLLKDEVPVNERIELGYSPLVAVILHFTLNPEAKLEIVKLMLEKGADPLIKNLSKEGIEFDAYNAVNLMLHYCDQHSKEIRTEILEEINYMKDEVLTKDNCILDLERMESELSSLQEAKRIYNRMNILLQKQQKKQEEAAARAEQQRLEELEIAANKLKSPDQKLQKEMQNLRMFVLEAKESKDCGRLVSFVNAANCNSQTSEGWTPLHLVARFGNQEQIKHLIGLGANFNAKTNDGISVLGCAVLSSNSQGNVRLLLKNDLAAETIFDGVNAAIQKRKDAVVKDILDSAVAIDKISSSDEGRSFVEGWNKSKSEVLDQGKKQIISKLVEAFNQKIGEKFSKQKTKSKKSSKLKSSKIAEINSESSDSSNKSEPSNQSEVSAAVEFETTTANELSVKAEEDFAEIAKEFAKEGEQWREQKLREEERANQINRIADAASLRGVKSGTDFEFEIVTNSLQISELNPQAEEFVPKKITPNSVVSGASAEQRNPAKLQGRGGSNF